MTQIRATPTKYFRTLRIESFLPDTLQRLMMTVVRRACNSLARDRRIPNSRGALHAESVFLRDPFHALAS